MGTYIKEEKTYRMSGGIRWIPIQTYLLTKERWVDLSFGKNNETFHTLRHKEYMDLETSMILYESS